MDTYISIFELTQHSTDYLFTVSVFRSLDEVLVGAAVEAVFVLVVFVDVALELSFVFTKDLLEDDDRKDELLVGCGDRGVLDTPEGDSSLEVVVGDVVGTFSVAAGNLEAEELRLGTGTGTGASLDEGELFAEEPFNTAAKE